MNWAAITSLFFFSTIKFLFTPFGGPALSASFWETYFSCLAGGIFSATIFFFAGEYFMKRAHRKKMEKYQLMEKNGTPLKKKPVFTRTNKFIVRLKKRFGIYGICIYAPLFLSIPIGSVISAKFYSHDRRAYPIILFGLIMNGIILTWMSYFIFS